MTGCTVSAFCCLRAWCEQWEEIDERPALARESSGWLLSYYIETGGILTRQKSAALLCL